MGFVSSSRMAGSNILRFTCKYVAHCPALRAIGCWFSGKSDCSAYWALCLVVSVLCTSSEDSSKLYSSRNTSSMTPPVLTSDYALYLILTQLPHATCGPQGVLLEMSLRSGRSEVTEETVGQQLCLVETPNQKPPGTHSHTHTPHLSSDKIGKISGHR